MIKNTDWPYLTTIDVDELRRRLPEAWQRVLLGTLDAILDRSRRDPDYPFIDTKISTLTGRELSSDSGASDLTGKDTIYSWIQGRGLEALAGHHQWVRTLTTLPVTTRHAYTSAIEAHVRETVTAMEDIRRDCGDGMFFWFDRAGRPFETGTDGVSHPIVLNTDQSRPSDVFYLKGLQASAHLLGDADLRDRACAYYIKVMSDLNNGRFVSDQQAFDPKNRVVPVPGRHSHGAWMLSIGTCALFAETSDDPRYVADGLACVRHIIDNHVNLGGRWPDLLPHDFVEFIDDDGLPWRENGHVACDPGHALEFVGLSLKLFHVIERQGRPCAAQQSFMNECREVFPEVLTHAFTLGFNPKAEGICKLYSLSERRPLNTDMPWWNLPETMRAAAFALELGPREPILEIIRRCSNAYLGQYVNPLVHMMAFQTRDAAGKPVAVIPATPDADPGYHTGLSIIDFLGRLGSSFE
ncbi:MAG: hypothetical protein HN919_05910 [Verrucomicrobia bacterium]|jgi:hypothetical protein|nr:hypothetical protein [Verrucomicrobiota bacterium]MBT7065816.1 hypothetical protein [Verrucomicrobiota bacterium]MBT7700274.1 hypothetical protein [Verrucomicrobiota bacterium]